MRVKNINWISIPAAEAAVEIVDGPYNCVAFSCPCEVYVDDEITEPLHVFNLRNAMLVTDVNESITLYGDTGLSQHVVARLIDQDQQLLRVGGILLRVDDYLPGGLTEGDLVEFDCGRIDLW